MASTERRLCLVRHCLTDFDVADLTGRFCGRSDPPLNTKGLDEAHRLAHLVRDVPYDKGYSGVAQRCRETLRVLLADRTVPIIEDSRLNEIDYGSWDGLTKGEIQTRYPEQWAAFERETILGVPVGGERVQDCVDRAMAWPKDWDRQFGLVVVDKTWLRLLVCNLLGAPLSQY